MRRIIPLCLITTVFCPTGSRVLADEAEWPTWLEAHLRFEKVGELIVA